jgi:hypothetical protein
MSAVRVSIGAAFGRATDFAPKTNLTEPAALPFAAPTDLYVPFLRAAAAAAAPCGFPPASAGRLLANDDIVIARVCPSRWAKTDETANASTTIILRTTNRFISIEIQDGPAYQLSVIIRFCDLY